MHETLQDCLAALRFFTRLPLPAAGDTERPLASAAVGFPLAGFIVGALAAFVWAAGASLLPPLPAAGLAVAAGLFITGALHDDGLSDCADGLGGSHSKDRALEIMRDSRIGAFGAAALIMTIGLRCTALSELELLPGIWALVIAHTISRSAILPALAFSSYARKEGLGSTVADGISTAQLVFALIVASLLALAFGGFAGLIATALALAAAVLFLKFLENRLGGYTGDGLGAMQQIAEITAMLVLCAIWSGT